ncbi:hypothetical protein L915_09262 [Phytophthora nicotianae]|uniref:Uncharacterized protein n=1 Tax=Phytophthora nicotianae TaxID=4792 RepID=W2GSY2_PHYNI|nr:hypothetical protein L915_09262 [Phytophthora nicotianae]ETL39505.1 hypothetical protein L916_09173 [Phytophthora nicotianae]
MPNVNLMKQGIVSDMSMNFNIENVATRHEE